MIIKKIMGLTNKKLKNENIVTLNKIPEKILFLKPVLKKKINFLVVIRVI